MFFQISLLQPLTLVLISLAFWFKPSTMAYILKLRSQASYFLTFYSSGISQLLPYILQLMSKPVTSLHFTAQE